MTLANEEENCFILENDERLDVAVSSYCSVTRSHAAKLIENGKVFIDGKPVTQKSLRCRTACTVTVIDDELGVCEAVAQDIPIDIVYEDDDIVVVNKPRGMVVHPAPGNYDKTLVNALLYHCKNRLSTINGVIRPGIVHRIDKDTSGLLVVAKNDDAHLHLAKQIAEHSFTRQYECVLCGFLPNESGVVNAPIGRSQNDRKKMTVTSVNSKPAVTHYKVLKEYDTSLGKYTHAQMTLETGRTHQIRVHMAHIGHSLLGDPLYGAGDGKNKFGIKGQCLHAKKLGFIHPSTKEYVEFSSDLPKDFQNVLDKLDKIGV